MRRSPDGLRAAGAALALALLAGNATAQPVPPAGSTAQKNALTLHRLDAAMAPGADLGSVSQGDACDNRAPLALEPATRAALGSALRRAVGEGFAAAGLRDPLGDPAASALRISAAIEHVRTRHCLRPTGTQTLGQLETRVRWEIANPATNEVLFAKTTAGQFRSIAYTPLTEGDYYRNGFLPAVSQLLAEPGFRDLAFKPLPERTGEAPSPRLTLAAAEVPAGSVGDALARVASSIVTVRTANRSGSGFFISADGHLLTTSHVVGDQNLVKLILADGREVDARVLRRHRGREVALLKTEAGETVPLAMQEKPVAQGDDVLIFGAPLSSATNATMAHGLVRELRSVNERVFIQTDASITKLGEGGPLIDATGRVIGIALGGTGRINFGAPAEEMLRVLQVDFAAR